MANDKLKSIFTKENCYTVLQSLKALAEGCDDVAINGIAFESTSDGENKIVVTLGDGTKLESEPFKARSALAEYITHNKDTNTTEIGTNAEIDGALKTNSTAIFLSDEIAFAKIPVWYLKDDNSTVAVTASFPALVYVPNEQVKVMQDGETAEEATFVGAYAVTAGNSMRIGEDSSAVGAVASPIYKEDGTVAQTMEDALNGHVAFADLFVGPREILVNETSNLVYKGGDFINSLDGQVSDAIQVALNNFRIFNPVISSGVIDSSVTLGNAQAGTTVGSLLNIIGAVSQARYQHTVTMRASDSRTDVFCFTAMSSKNTPIDSYQDLNTVFGGCVLAGCGVHDTKTNTYNKLNLKGGSIATDFLTDGEETHYLSSFTGLAYSDDVCIPK